MNCKSCNAEPEEGQTLCPVCGQENTDTAAFEPAEEVQTPAAKLETEQAAQELCDEEAVCVEQTPDEQPEESQKPKSQLWKIILAAACGAVLMAVLVLVLLYGLGIDLTPKTNDVQVKASYTVDVATAQEQADKVVATIGKAKLTNAQLQIYYWNQVYDFMSNYGQQYFDVTADMSKQVFSQQTGMTWQQYFVDIALKTWQRYQTLSILSQEEDFQLTEDQNQYLASIPETLQQMAVSYGLTTAEELVRADMGGGATVDAYVEYMTDYYTGLEFFNAKYDELDPTQEEIEAYFAENEATFTQSGVTKDSGNQVDVRHILLQPEDDTQEAKDACYAEAQKLLEAWKNAEATEESFAELANTHSKDGGSNTTGGLYQGITAQTNFVESFLNWCMDPARQIGDTGIVESEHGYHIMYFSAAEPVWVSSARTALIADRASALIEDGMERHPMKVSYKKIVLADVSEQTAPADTQAPTEAVTSTGESTAAAETTAAAG